MKAVAEVIGVSRSNLIERLRDRPKKRLGRPPLPDDELVADIKAVIAELPTYDYRHVHPLLSAATTASECGLHFAPFLYDREAMSFLATKAVSPAGPRVI